MALVSKDLFGFWKMTEMRFRRDSGNWENEVVYGGSSIFTEDGFINTFTRTSEIPFGYSGTFSIEGDTLIIHTEVCTINTLEGKTIMRTVKEVTQNSLVLTMTDEATGRFYEIYFKLLTRSFLKK